MGDSLRPEDVVPRLRGRFGADFYLYERVCQSTQRLLPEGEREGAVAVTDHQTAGRGRLGRSWHDVAGKSLLFSVLLRPRVAPARLPELSLAAGRACAAAIAAVAGVEPTLKFPNDVLIGGRKVAGILAEARDDRVTLGIGINVAQTEAELPAGVDIPPTSLLLESGRTVDRAELLTATLAHLEREYDEWLSDAR